MSWNYSQEYACISFDRAVPEAELRSMLAELAITLLDRQQGKVNCLDQLEDIANEVETGEISREEALEQITDISQNFLQNIDHSDDCTSLLVLSEYQSEYYDTDMAKEIAKHLFAKTNQSHFIWRSAAFDNGGAYSHQWVGFRAEQQVVLVHTDEYFARQFPVPVSA